MILHLNQEDNDCIWKLQCLCIQILHSKIYSVVSAKSILGNTVFKRKARGQTKLLTCFTHPILSGRMIFFNEKKIERDSNDSNWLLKVDFFRKKYFQFLRQIQDLEKVAWFHQKNAQHFVLFFWLGRKKKK